MKLLKFIILILLSNISFAQELQYSQEVRRPKDLWNVSIQNEEALKVVLLHGVITSKTSGVIYEATTSQFQLPSGTQLLRSYLFSKVSELQSTLTSSNQVLEEGIYEFKTEVVDFYTNEILGFTSLEVTILSDIDESDANNLDVEDNKPVLFSLRGEISSQYAYDFKTDYNSNEYTRFNFNPSITLFDVPVSADIFITTNNENAIQNANYFNVHFDYYKYQQILMDKALTYLEENPNLAENKEKLLVIKEEKLESTIKNYKEWKTKLGDPELKSILKEVEKLDALESVIENKELKEKYNKITKLKSKYSDVSLDELKDPLKSLEKAGINQDKLIELYEDKEILSLIQTKGEKIIPQLEELKTLKNPNDFLDYAKLYSSEKLDNLDIDNAFVDLSQNFTQKSTQEWIEQLPVSESDKLNKILASYHKKDFKSIKNYDKEQLEDLLNNEVSKKKSSNKKILAKTINAEQLQYEKLLGKFSSKDWNELAELDEKQLNTLLNKFSKRDIDNIRELMNKGLTKSNQLKELGSWKEVQEMVNFDKEYTSILNNYERILENKKAYKSAIKAKEQIDKIEGLNVREILNDPQTVKEFAKDFDVLSSSANLLTDFRAIELGDVYPVYNELMLNGVKLKGGNVEWAPKKFYIGVTSGKIKNQVFINADTTQNTLNEEKVVYAAKLGIGDKNENHVHLTYLGGITKFDEETTSISAASNHVVGLDGSYNLMEKIKLEGEFNYSIYNPNRNANQEIKQSLQQKGYAYQLRATALIPKGELYVQTEQVSALYNTFGLPYIINDRWTIESGVNKSFFDNQMQTNLYFKNETTNNGFNSKIKAYSGNFNVLYRPKNKPYVNIFYNLLHLDSDGHEVNGVQNIAHNVSVATGYNFTIKKTNFTSQATYAFQLLNTQNIETLNSGSVTLYYDKYYMQRANIVTLSQQVKISKVQLSAFGQINRYDIDDAEISDNLYSIEGTIGIPLFKNKLRTLIGAQYSKLGESTKMSYFSQLNFPVTKYLNFNFNIKYDHISDQQEQVNQLYQGLNFFGRLNFKF